MFLQKKQSFIAMYTAGNLKLFPWHDTLYQTHEGVSNQRSDKENQRI